MIMDTKFKNVEACLNRDKYIFTNTTSSESFPKLLKELIKLYSKGTLKIKNANQFTLLKNRLYSTIFSHKEDKASLPSVSNLEQLLWYSYTLHKKRRFDEANQLKRHLKYFQDRGLLLENSLLQSVLRLLICLTDNETNNYPKTLAVPTPRIISPKEVETLGLPAEPLCYNDTQWDCAPSRWHYTHFPPSLFKVDESILFTPNESLAWKRERLGICDKEPGIGHTFNFFSEIDYDPSKSCLGALAGPRKINSPLSPDTVLSIPNLPIVPQDYSFIPFINQRSQGGGVTPQETHKNYPNEFGTVDEGYVSSHGSDEGKSPSKLNTNDVWQQFPLKGDSELPSKRYSWETASGSGGSSCREKPFLSEAGSQVTQRLWPIEQLHISTLDPSTQLPSYRQMPTEAELCMHILYLLIGLPSASFFFIKGSFKVTEGLCYKGSTPESLQRHLRELTECGDQILSLEEFCQTSPFNEDKSPPDTLALKSFKRPIQAFLLHYRQKVLQLEGESKFLSLKLRSLPLRKKMRYVSRLCRDANERSWFGDTLDLISGLKKELLLTQDASHLCLLLSFLNAASKPFLMFLEKWMYEGEIGSSDVDFLVLPDPVALRKRTRQYWTHGYMLSERFADRVPDFLKGILTGVFLCGKAVNLLGLVFPQSFLLSNSSQKHPTISLCSSLNQVQLARLQCQKYAIEMDRQSSQHLVTVRMVDEERAQREKQLARIACERHQAFLRSFKEQKTNRLMSDANKKRELLTAAKKDVDESQKWKESRKEEERRVFENASMEQLQLDFQNHLEEGQQRAAVIARFQKKMETLDSSEMAVWREISLLSKGLKLESVVEKEEMDKDSHMTTERERMTDTDNESSSRMSTASDICSEPLIQEVESPETIADISPSCVEPNNNKTETRIDESEEPTTCNVVPLKKILDSVDKLNGKPFTSPVENYVILEVLGSQETNLGWSRKSGRQRDVENNKTHNTSLQSDEDIKCTLETCPVAHDIGSQVRDAETNRQNQAQDKADTNNTLDSVTEPPKETKLPIIMTDSSTVQSRLHSSAELTPAVDENENPTSSLDPKMTDNKYTERFQMRKSKSESSSLRDVGKKERTSVKMSQRMSLFDLKESDAPVLIDKVGGEVLKHRGRNTHGHASDSVIQEILKRHASKEHQEKDKPANKRFFDREELEALMTSSIAPIVPYSIESCGTDAMDVTSSFLNKWTKLTSRHPSAFEDVKTRVRNQPRPSQLSFAPVYIIRGIAQHLDVQSRLVNQALLSHYLVERNLLGHFEALRDFLLFHDAGFALVLIAGLVQKFPPGSHLGSAISPAEINAILNEAIAASSSPRSSLASNLTFIVKNCSPSAILPHPLDCIELRYMADWPLSIILDDKILSRYAELSKFLSHLRQLVWAIEDVFKCTVTFRQNTSQARETLLFHRLDLFRYEVQQFIRVLFGYVCHQAIEGSWRVFQMNLRQVSTFSDLYKVHEQFVDDVSEKCFLTPDTAHIQSQIQELWVEVLLFQNLTKNRFWQRTRTSDASLEMLELNAIEPLMSRYRLISSRLSQILQRTLLDGEYANHIEDLVSQLTFNDNFHLLKL